MEPVLQKATQRIEETPIEASSRRAQKFADVEASLDATSRKTTTDSEDKTKKSYFSRIKSLRQYIPPVSRQLFDNVTSYLGKTNPLALPAHPSKDAVWLFDNIAYRPIHPYPHSEQPWHAEFVAGFFNRNSGKDVSRWVADIADKVGLRDMEIPDEEGEKNIAERIAPFLDVIRPARFVDVTLEGEAGLVRRLGPAGRSAVSSQIEGPLGEFRNGDVVHTNALLKELTPHGPMKTFFANPEGWLIISDIDDTIKVTMTPSPIGILRSTFVATPEPTENMPPFYIHLNKTLDSPPFFYVSASPYNLYPFLRLFIHTHYPPGPLLLRDASWITPTGLLQTLTQGVQAYKVERFNRIHQWLPQRRVLCIGDSTQSDPEAYAEIYRKYPGWVKGIFIRKVLGLSGMEEKNNDERFEKAFEGLPRSVWRVFVDPEELTQAVEGLKTI